MMATCLPGDILARAWRRQVGRLQPGAQADLVVVNAKRRVDAFRTIVRATEDDVDLVVINGERRYGTQALISGVSTMTTLTVGGRAMQLSLGQPSDLTKAWEWAEVVDRMEEVRAHPKREVEAANAMYARWAGRLDDREAPLRLALDMPTGLARLSDTEFNRAVTAIVTGLRDAHTRYVGPSTLRDQVAVLPFLPSSTALSPTPGTS
jgi:5-methylthioadenosine/S-adenosylhomocysteine deaminase